MNTAIIIARICINPLVNACQKKLTSAGISPLHLVLFTYTVCAAVSIPIVFMHRHTALPASFWYTIAAMTFFGSIGNALLVLALKHSDLSVFGPINAFKPVIGLILAFCLIGEIPSYRGITGAVIIVAGSVLLSFVPGEGLSLRSFTHMMRSKGVLLRISSLTLISIEAVLMKKAVISAGPLLTFSWWALAGAPLLFLLCRIIRPGVIMKNIRLCAAMPAQSAVTFLLYGIMQFFTFIIFMQLIVGYSLALFQLSAVINVFLGYALFKEKALLPRLAGCAIMIAGAALIIA